MSESDYISFKIQGHGGEKFGVEVISANGGVQRAFWQPAFDASRNLIEVRVPVTDLVKDVKANPLKRAKTDTDAKKHFLQYVTQVKVQFGSALARDDKGNIVIPGNRRQLISNFAISNCIRSP